MFNHKGTPRFRLLTHDDASGLLQHDAEQGADARRSSPDDEHGVLLAYLAYARSPVARGEDVAHEECLFVADGVGDAVESLRGKGYAHIFRLPAVDAAAQCPTAVWRCAVVHIAVPAEEALPAEGLDIHCHAVAHAYAFHFGTDFLHHSHHLVAHSDAGNGPRHTAVLYVEVARADAAKRHTHDGVGGFENHGTGFVGQGEPAFLYVCVCFHTMPLKLFVQSYKLSV